MKQNIIFEEEIDFKDFFITIWAKKFFILIFTFIITISGFIYSLTKTEVYEAKAVLEIGSFTNGNNFSNFNNYNSFRSFIEHPPNLVKKIQIEKSRIISEVHIIHNTQNILEIIIQDESKEKANNNMLSIVNEIIDRHNQEIKNFKALIQIKIDNLLKQRKTLDKKDKYFNDDFATKYKLISEIDNLNFDISSHSIKNTKLIGTVTTSEFPISSNKEFIIVMSFVIGFIMAVFLVFFIRFIGNLNNEDR